MLGTFSFILFTIFYIQDVQYADIDHMEEQKDFTIDNKTYYGLKEYFDELRSNGMRTIIILVKKIDSLVDFSV